jgi:hypothetical protein
VAVVLSILDALDEISIVLMLDEWETHIKGFWQARKS